MGETRRSRDLGRIELDDEVDIGDVAPASDEVGAEQGTWVLVGNELGVQFRS